MRHIQLPLLAFASAIAASCAAGAAGAADQPAYLPTRDVTIDYVVTPQNREPEHAQVAVQAGGAHLRLDTEAVPGPVLIDRDHATAVLVYPPAKLFTQLPSRGFRLDRLIAEGHPQFSRLGAAEVIGLRCTEYRIVARQGSGQGCLTDDGVLLRGSGQDLKGHGGAVLATAVRYAPVPASAFVPPPGYQELPPGALQALLPGLGR